MCMTRLTVWTITVVAAGALAVCGGCSKGGDESGSAPAPGAAQRSPTKPAPSTPPVGTAPAGAKGEADSRIPWTVDGCDVLRGLHLRIWGMTSDDVKNVQEIVSGRRKITPRVSEIWFTAEPPRLRVDRFWDQSGPYPKDLTEFEGHPWETITFEGKPFVLYERVVIDGTQETAYALKKLRTVFNRDGVQGARAEIGTFEKAVRPVPAPTVAAALKAGTLDLPVMRAQACQRWLDLLERGDREKLPQRYEQAMEGLRERRTIAGRTAARYVHSATLESVLRYDFVDLKTAVGLEGHLIGWAGPASYRPAWKEDYCIYRVVLFDPNPPAAEVFNVWKD